MRPLALAAALAIAAAPVPADHHKTTETVLAFDALDGWAEDDHDAALRTFSATCGDMDDAEWAALCRLAHEDPPPARIFFELLFRPVVIEDGAPALFTGYYEPELAGSRVRTGRYRHPIYRMPPDLPKDVDWYTRSDIERFALLAGRGLEIAWLADPVDVHFLQIQGSGRIVLPDGEVVRVGFAGANGRPYRSLGEELVRRGLFEPHEVSGPVIRDWVRENPRQGLDLLRHNESFVFFREVTHPPELGPLGAMNRPITAGRSVAVDPDIVPLGAPVWVEKEGHAPMRRLMVAQDTGSAIKGAQRADIFFGTGDQAGRAARRIKDGGRMVVLMPLFQVAELPHGGTEIAAEE